MINEPATAHEQARGEGHGEPTRAVTLSAWIDLLCRTGLVLAITGKSGPEGDGLLR